MKAQAITYNADGSFTTETYIAKSITVTLEKETPQQRRVGLALAFGNDLDELQHHVGNGNYRTLPAPACE